LTLPTFEVLTIFIASSFRPETAYALARLDSNVVFAGELDGPPEFRDRFVKSMLLLQSLTQLIMGDREVRIRFNGLLTLLHGFVITVSDA